MLGTKLYKNNKSDMANYTKTAVWCNANNAHITDKGEYYEVVENVPYIPSQEEQIAQLDSQYTADKEELARYFLQFQMAGDTAGMLSIQAELEELNKQYDTALAEIEGGE